MGVVVGIKSKDGVVIAGDTQAVTDEKVTSRDVQRIFDFDDVGIGVVGETGGIQEFRRHFEKELRALRIDSEDEVDIDKVALIAGRQAKNANVSAVVAARDSDGTSRLQEVGADGHVLENTTVALGSGAEIASGQLETVDAEGSIAEVASNVSDVVEIVQTRDTDSGGDIDVWSLPDSTSEENAQT